MYSKTIEQVLYSQSSKADQDFVLSHLPKELQTLYKIGTDPKLYEVKGRNYDPGDWGVTFDICVAEPWIDSIMLREFIESDYKDKSFQLEYPYNIDGTRIQFAQLHVQGHMNIFYDFKNKVISMGEMIKRPEIIIRSKIQLRNELIKYFSEERAEVQEIVDANDRQGLKDELDFIDKIIKLIKAL